MGSTVLTRAEVHARLDELAQGATGAVRTVVASVQKVAAVEPPAYDLETMTVLVEAVARLRAEPPTVVASLANRRAADAYFDQQQQLVGHQMNVGSFFQTAITIGSDQSASAPPTLAVPVVLAVMNTELLEELHSGAAFAAGPSELESDFRALEQVLEQEGCGDLAGRYGTRGADWRPFGPQGPTIEKVVNEIFVWVNGHGKYTRRVDPWMLDLRDALDDRSTLLTLRKGCIVVLDTISMRHPSVQRWFHRSMLDAYPSTAVLAVAPIARVHEVSRDLSVFIQLPVGDLEFAKRLFDLNEVAGICKESAKLEEIEQWLVTRVREHANDAGAATGAPRLVSSEPVAAA